jgi:hypothetical protein
MRSKSVNPFPHVLVWAWLPGGSIEVFSGKCLLLRMTIAMELIQPAKVTSLDNNSPPSISAEYHPGGKIPVRIELVLLHPTFEFHNQRQSLEATDWMPYDGFDERGMRAQIPIKIWFSPLPDTHLQYFLTHILKLGDVCSTWIGYLFQLGRPQGTRPVSENGCGNFKPYVRCRDRWKLRWNSELPEMVQRGGRKPVCIPDGSE